MTHPTDDELEVMAVRMDHGFDTLSEAEGAMDDAAAMLRACKGRAAWPDIHRRWNRDMDLCIRIDEALNTGDDNAE